MTLSRLQEALAAKEQMWGGWVVGPTIIGPEEFAKAGYDYVGFDVQHGYLDDADVALLLRRLEHVPDRHRGAAAVGRSRADRPGARRRRRRGHHRDGRIGRTGGRRGRRHPLRARRGAQLRAAAGRASGTTPPRSRRG